MQAGALTARPAAGWWSARRGLALEATCVGLGVGLLYLATLAGNHVEAEDGLRYAADVREGDPTYLFSAYHLIYNWLVWAIWHGARALGFDGGPVVAAQVLNAVTGAAGIACLWVLLRTIAPGRLVAAAGCGLLAFSYGYWWYSVEVEVYILAALLLILTLASAWYAAIAPSWRRFALFGAVNGLAVLGHNTNVLFAGVAVAALLIAHRTLPWRGVMRCALAYAGAAVAASLPLYVLAVAVLKLRTPGQVYDWVTEYAQRGTWGHVSLTNIPKATIGLLRALIGGQFALSLDPVARAAERVPGMGLREKLFLVQDYNRGLAALLLLLAAVAGLGIVALAAGWLRRPSLSRGEAVLALLCAAWLVVYVPFFAWWDPSNIEFWLAVWIPLAILLALPLRALHAERRWWHGAHVAAAVIGLLFAVNLLGSILPQRSSEHDYWRTRVAWYEANAEPTDLVVTTGYVWSNYLVYFGRTQVLNAGEVFFDHGDDRAAAITELRRRIAEAGAARVLFSSEVLGYEDTGTPVCAPTDAECLDTAALRDAFLGSTRMIADGPEERVRQLVQP